MEARSFFFGAAETRYDTKANAKFDTAKVVAVDYEGGIINKNVI